MRKTGIAGKARTVRKLLDLWNRARSGFWLIPTVFFLAACVLSHLAKYVDTDLAPDLANQMTVLFGGTPGGARALLSAIAGSLIAAISVIFSVTIVALQQASSQYSPRILRNFTQDRGNQATLGVFLGTFIYCILIMRKIRSASDSVGVSAFVPAFAVTMAIVLTLVSPGLSDLLHPPHLARDPALDGEPNETEQQALARTRDRRRGIRTRIGAPRRGYLQDIHHDTFKRAAHGAGARFAYVQRAIGDYVFGDLPLLEVWSDRPLGEREKKAFLAAFDLASERSIRQDALFGMRQLVDIGLKALSPGVKDPTTAEQCIRALGDVNARLMTRNIPSPLQQDRDVLSLFTRPSLRDYLELSFGQLITAARRDPHVSGTILMTLREIATCVPSTERLELPVEKVQGARDTFLEGEALPSEKATVRQLAQEYLGHLQERRNELLQQDPVRQASGF